MKAGQRVAIVAGGISLLAVLFALSRGSNTSPPVARQPAHAPERAASLPTASARTTPVTARELALQLQVQSLEQRLARLESGQGTPSSASSSDKPEARPETRAPLTPEEYEAARRAALEASEKRFSAASGSSDWGKQHEASYLSFRPKTGHVQAAACRAEMCRLEVVHDSPQDAERFVDETELDPRFANVSIRWFYANREKTRRVLFIEPPARPRPRE